VAGQLAVDDHHRGMHLALDGAVLGQDQGGGLARRGRDLALDPALDMQAAGEIDVAVDHHARPDQGVDGEAVTLLGGLALEHHLPPPTVAGFQSKTCSAPAPVPWRETRIRCGVKSLGSITLPPSSWK